MNQPTDWTAALAFLAAGLVVGVALFFAMRRKRGAETIPEDPLLAALEKKRDDLIRRIRREKDDQERARLERQAADVLREIDQYETPAGKQTTPFFARHPAVKGYLLGVASTLAIGLLGYYGWRSAAPRDESTTPAAPMAAPDASAPDTSPLRQLERAVQNDPQNVDHRIALAKAYFERDNLMAVFEQTSEVLRQHPDEPRALTYNAIVRMAMGQLEDAKGMLERATRSDPKLIDGWLALASVRLQTHQEAAAKAAIESAIAQDPSQEARLRDLFAQMKARSAAPAAQTAAAPGESLPPDHPPLRGSAPAPQPPAGGTSAPIRLTLTLDPSAKVRRGIVYIIARAGGAGSAHPVAVKRVVADSFPLSVSFGQGDAMMGQPMPARVNIEARLDTDGDAGTSDPSDPKAFASGVDAGASLALTLK